MRYSPSLDPVDGPHVDLSGGAVYKGSPDGEGDFRSDRVGSLRLTCAPDLPMVCRWDGEQFHSRLQETECCSSHAKLDDSGLSVCLPE